MFRARVSLLIAAFALFLAGGAALPTASGEVVRVEINRRAPLAEGKAFGKTGAYEILEGRLFFEADPSSSLNARVVDLKLAPVNAGGRVEYWQDFFLIQPADPKKGNGCLLYDVHNRGNKLALWTFNDGERTNDPATEAHAGNGFLLREGYAILWTGWSGDVVEDGGHRLLAGLPIARMPDGGPVTGRNYVEISVDAPVFSQPFFGSPWGTSAAYPAVSLDNADATLTRRASRAEPPTEVPRDQWGFARWDEGKVVPDAANLYIKEGLKPGWLYELTYTARDPRVSGLGLAGIRDAVEHFRHGDKDNPLAGAIDRAIIFGVSQAGRLANHFFWDGFNADSQGRRVFDGALIHVAGAGRGLFNVRFGMATVYGTAHRGQLTPSDTFPFAPMPMTDDASGTTGDSMALAKVSRTMPKVFFTQTSTEYWNRAASLLHTSTDGKADLEIDPSVRVYHIAGTQHLDGTATDRGICRHPKNPVKHRGPVLRALITRLDRWIAADTAPPDSRIPRIADGTLVSLEAFRASFPKIPGVDAPTMLNRPQRLDFDAVPPRIVGNPYVTLVPAVDADGNERSGIRLPQIAVPQATYTGWNERGDLPGVLSDLDGSYLEFAKTKAGRERSGDPRLSLEERYASDEERKQQAVAALRQLQAEGFLLEEDVERMTK
jgi:hypothetical protein